MWWQSNIGGSYNGVGEDDGVAGDHGGGCKADGGGGKSKKDFLTELTPLDGEKYENDGSAGAKGVNGWMIFVVFMRKWWLQ